MLENRSSRDKAIKNEARPELNPKDDEYVGRTARDNG